VLKTGFRTGRKLKSRKKNDMKRKDTTQVVAELLDVLNRHGLNVDSPYVLENFLHDFDVDEALATILTDNQCRFCTKENCKGCDEYGKKPIAERIARYSKLGKA